MGFATKILSHPLAHVDTYDDQHDQEQSPVSSKKPRPRQENTALNSKRQIVVRFVSAFGSVLRILKVGESRRAGGKTLPPNSVAYHITCLFCR